MSRPPPLPQPQLQPRKSPKQARSAVTVEAIFQGTLQVLAQVGLERLTTTRVAERAGVSVGTLYQYYPNRESLLLAVLERHLEGVVQAIALSCQGVLGRSRCDMAQSLVHAFLGAKMALRDESHALAPVALLTSGVQAVQRATQQAQQVVVDMLLTAEDVWCDPVTGTPAHAVVERRARVLTAALVGPVQALVEANAGAQAESELRLELELLAVAYWQAGAGL